MRRFALGFVFGVAVSVAVVLALPGAERAPAQRPTAVTENARPPSDESDVEPDLGPVRRRFGAAADGVLPDRDADVESGAPSTPGDVFARVRQLIAAGELPNAGLALADAVVDHPEVPPPRELIVALARATDEQLRHPFNHPWGDIVKGLHRWPNEWHVQALEELTADVHGTHPLAILSGEIAGVLAVRGHSHSALAERLAESPSFRHRLSGLHLAATADDVGYELLARMAREDVHEDVRDAAIAHLRNRGVGMGDSTARPILGAIAVELFDRDGTPRLRETAVTGLVYGGVRGVAIAEQVVVEGGLSEESETLLMAALLEEGRFRSMLGRGVSDSQFLLRLATAVFHQHEPNSEHVLALWPHLPEVLNAPLQEWTEYVGETLVEIGRPDLAAEIAANASLLPKIRTGAIFPLAEYGHPARALALVRAILGDSTEPVELRKDALWALEIIGRVGDHRQATEALALAAATERDDPNSWVRRDAELARESIERALESRESER